MWQSPRPSLLLVGSAAASPRLRERCPSVAALRGLHPPRWRSRRLQGHRLVTLTGACGNRRALVVVWRVLGLVTRLARAAGAGRGPPRTRFPRHGACARAQPQRPGVELGPTSSPPIRRERVGNGAVGADPLVRPARWGARAWRVHRRTANDAGVMRTAIGRRRLTSATRTAVIRTHHRHRSGPSATHVARAIGRRRGWVRRPTPTTPSAKRIPSYGRIS